MDAYNYLGTFAWTIGTIVALLLFGTLWAVLSESLTEASRTENYKKCMVLVVLLVLLAAGTLTLGIAAYRSSHPEKPSCTRTLVRGRTSAYWITSCTK